MAKRIINLTRKHWYAFFLAMFCTSIMILGIRGNWGNPIEDELNTLEWKEEGPLELSPERGRFILAYSLVENGSFHFSEKLAKFGSPDVAVTKDGHFASLFAPTLSFLVIPGFLIGKFFGASQVGAYFVITLFAVFNVLLIRKIALILGVNNIPATVAGITFLFATPAFAYGVNLYQHHVSTFLILSSILLLLRFKGFISLILIFFICSLALTLDYPNFFMLFPLGIVALIKIFSVDKLRSKLKITIRPYFLLSLLSAIFPILFLLWFNYQSFGNPFQLSGTLKTIKNLERDDIKSGSLLGIQPVLEETLGDRKTAIGFFETRNLTNGLYMHFLSPDRGITFYTPVMFFAVLGMIIAVKRKLPQTKLIIAIIGTNIILYSMWGDPWGGWAFGSRYLIPVYAFLSIFIAIFLSKYQKNIYAMIIFLIILAYSIFVNSLGAITSSANPPQVEILSIEKLSGREEKYTYFRNLDYMLAGNSKSFLFRTFAKNYLQAWQYQYILFTIIFVTLALLILLNIYIKRKAN